MKLLILLALLVTDIAQAGTLNKGVWTASGCGEKPNPPLIDDRNADAFNRSAEAINDWQQQAKNYYDCLIKEANSDNEAIVKIVNQELDGHKNLVDRLAAKSNAVRKKLLRQR